MLNIIHKLRNTNSTKGKERILEAHKDDDDWTNYLIAVYNPYITYNKTGDKNEGENDLLNLKLCRSIRAGISAKTINKVYGKNIIPQFGMQKALDYKNFKHTARRDDKIDFPCVASIKYDGFGTVCIVDRDNPQFFTSGGHPFEVEKSQFDNLADGVYMFEMLGKGVKGKLGDRVKCGIQTTLRTNTAKGIKNTSEFDARIFNYVTLDEFYAGKATTSFENRWLTMFEDNLDLDFELADITADGKMCHNMDELNDFYYSTLNDGWEGIIITQPSHLWHNDGKRTVGLVKRKGRQTADLLCFDWKAGNGKNQDKIGSIGLKDKQDREVWVSPRTDEDKERDPSYYLGEIIEIDYEQILKDGTYIQPVFNCVRHDKAKGDYQ